MSSAEPHKARFSGRSLLKNTSLNIIGQIVPILVALFSMPVLIHRLGSERFGVLMLAWMCLGYFNLFDFGLNRALTKSIAERLGTERESEIPKVFWSTLATTTGLGLFGGIVLAVSANYLVTTALKIPHGLETEALYALYIIAACLPFVITVTSFKGLLEATQNFLDINRIQIPMGVGFYLLPILVTFYSISLPLVIGALVFARLAGWVFFFIVGLRNLPERNRGVVFSFDLMPGLLKFGGWVTVSNTVGPIINYGDRFVIGSLLSMSAVTFYSTPYEIVTKMWIFPGAVMSVMFPALASYLVAEPERASRAYHSSSKLIFSILAPLTLIIVLFAQEGLQIWAGPELASRSYAIMKILAVAVFINCFAVVPAAMLEALGRPKVPAISHVIQLPLYFIALYSIVPTYGLEGAALIWVGRNLIETSTQYFFAGYFSSFARIQWRAFTTVGVPFLIAVGSLAAIDLSLATRVTIAVVFMLLFLPWLWISFFNVADRERVSGLIFQRFRSNTPRSTLPPSTRERLGIALAAYQPDPDFFGQQLQSIAEQSFTNWVCIISMDDEIDKSHPSLEKFVGDPRFRWVENRGERGIKGNFAYAISLLVEEKVDMVALADQDDVWYPNKLDRLVTELRKCGPLSLVHSDMHFFERDDQLDDKSKLPSAWKEELRVVEGYQPLHFFFRNTVTGASCIFDVGLAEIGKKIPDSVDYHDQWYAILAAIKGEVRALPEPLYAYRQHSSNAVGIITYDGLLSKPEGKTWVGGVRSTVLNWQRSATLYTELKMALGPDALPPVYETLFSRPGLSSPLFAAIALMLAKNDPPLARAFLARGLGAFGTFLGVHPAERKRGSK